MNIGEEKISLSQILSIKNIIVQESFIKFLGKNILIHNHKESLNLFSKSLTLQNIPIHSNREFLNLFSKSLILHREEFNYLHVGLVQVAVKPLFKLGLDIPVHISLRDKRHEDFSNSLLGMIQSNSENELIYFNCYPNFALSLNDPHILSALMLDLE